jgi:hypothetical protein
MSRPKTLRWDPDIDWLINDAPAALGERGSPPGPGGGRAQLSDTWPCIERAHGAMHDVERERDLRRAWCRLTAAQAGILREYYQRRNSCQVVGAIAAFSDAPVSSQTRAGGAFAAIWLADRAGLGAELRAALGRQGKSQSVPVISSVRRALADALHDAHETWRLSRSAKRMVAP